MLVPNFEHLVVSEQLHGVKNSIQLHK